LAVWAYDADAAGGYGGYYGEFVGFMQALTKNIVDAIDEERKVGGRNNLPMVEMSLGQNFALVGRDSTMCSRKSLPSEMDSE